VTIYLELTREFNAGRLRAVICSGQAAVLLARHGARYRFGAPLDVRWLSGGWSAHFEFVQAGLRVRTDFFSRPPRVTADELRRLWREQEGRDPPFIGARMLAEMKKTGREKDYPFIGELARRMQHPREKLLYSRSAEDLLELARRHPGLVTELQTRRPLLGRIGSGRRALAEAIQLEMLDLMEADERRLAAFRAVSAAWAEAWPALARELEGSTLLEAHAKITERALGLLPGRVSA
jgi:hypothetical protein